MIIIHITSQEEEAAKITIEIVLKITAIKDLNITTEIEAMSIIMILDVLNLQKSMLIINSSEVMIFNLMNSIFVS